MTDNRLKWFTDARFGMFIHWGLYAIPGGIWRGQAMEYIGEWVQANFRIPNAEYGKLAEQFNPTAFDAEKWVMTAKAAGMRYIVYTAKHHEGFAMYHSHVSAFNIVDATPFKRDPLAELAKACAKHDVKLGVYYSQDLDWHEENGGDPGPDFPKNKGMSWGNDWDFQDYKGKSFRTYFDAKVIPQLTELLTNYGAISVLWCDCPVSITHEMSKEIVALVHRLQPSCLINTRLGHGLGDFGSLGDNQLPSARLEGAWESPATLNDTWGYKVNDTNWRTAQEVIQTLTALAAKDTNYLLNVGPQPDGNFPAAANQILQEVGRWLINNGDGIFSTSGNPFPYDFPWGYMTVTRGEVRTKLNLFIREEAAKKLVLSGINDKVVRCYALGNPGQELPFTRTSVHEIQTLEIDLSQPVDRLFLSCVVVELDTFALPRIDARFILQDGQLQLKPSGGTIRHGTVATIGEQSAYVGAAGERGENAGRCSLDDCGLLVDWHNPSDSINWGIVIPEPGRYRVEIITKARWHGKSWHDGQTIQIALASSAIHAWDIALQGQPIVSADERHYPRGISNGGEFVIAEPFQGTFRLSMKEPDPSGSVDMALEYVRIYSVQNL